MNMRERGSVLKEETRERIDGHAHARARCGGDSGGRRSGLDARVCCAGFRLVVCAVAGSRQNGVKERP